METFKTVYEGELVSRCENQQGTVIQTSPNKDALFSPTDLFAVSLGSCILTMMGIKAKALQVDITGAEVRVEKKMTLQPVLRIGRLKINVSSSRSFDEETQRALEEEAKNCPIHKSIHPDIPIEMHFTWGKNDAV